MRFLGAIPLLSQSSFLPNSFHFIFHRLMPYSLGIVSVLTQPETETKPHSNTEEALMRSDEEKRARVVTTSWLMACKDSLTPLLTAGW
jgi:beta-lactamase class D